MRQAERLFSMPWPTARRFPGSTSTLLGEYDFSEEKLQDKVGIKPPKLPPKKSQIFGSCRIALLPVEATTCEKSCGTLRSFVQI
jgi:hypothetical protein